MVKLYKPNIKPLKLIDLIKKNPVQFFVCSPQGEFEAYALHREFIKVAFEGGCFPLPDHVRLSSFGEHHTTIAQGTELNIEDILNEDIPVDLEGHQSFIEWVLFRKATLSQDKSRLLGSFQVLSYIIYATEFCMMDISTQKEHIQQMFFYGKAASSCIRRPLSEFPVLAPFIGLRFTPSKELFQSRVATFDQIQKMMSRQEPNRWIPPGIQVKVIENHAHSFEISLKSEETLEMYLTRKEDILL